MHMKYRCTSSVQRMRGLKASQRACDLSNAYNHAKKKQLRGQAPRVKQNHHIGSQSHTQAISHYMLYSYIHSIYHTYSYSNLKHVPLNQNKSRDSQVTDIFSTSPALSLNAVYNMIKTCFSYFNAVSHGLVIFCILVCMFCTLSPYPLSP